jgi:hypothetical protein
MLSLTPEILAAQKQKAIDVSPFAITTEAISIDPSLCKTVILQGRAKQNF